MNEVADLDSKYEPSMAVEIDRQAQDFHKQFEGGSNDVLVNDCADAHGHLKVHVHKAILKSQYAQSRDRSWKLLELRAPVSPWKFQDRLDK